MKKIFNSLMILAAAAATFASCSKEVDTQSNEPSGKKMKTVMVKTGIDTRTTLDASHENLIWSAGDKMSIFNDTDDTNLEMTYVGGGDLIVEVPAETEEIYAHYPYYNGNTAGPDNVSVYITKDQKQTNPGELNGYNYPMVAKGTVEEVIVEGETAYKAIISLYPVASALALNIYKTGLAEGERETVKSVKVTPSSSNTGFIGRQYTNLKGKSIKYTAAESSDPITVTLTNPLTLGSTKPADSQKFDGQIYVCLAKQSYANVSFEIQTNKGTYTISSNATPFDCASNDFVPVNINLSANAATFVPAEELSGTYVILAEKEGTYYAMANTHVNNSNRLDEVEFNKSATTTDNRAIVWTITKSGDNYTITDVAGQYLTASSSNNANVNPTAAYCTILETDGSYSITQNDRYLSRNNNDLGFAFYNNTGQNHTLYLIPIDLQALPTLSWGAESIMIEADDEDHHEITLTTTDATSVSLAIYEEDEETEVEWLVATYEDGVVTYMADANESDVRKAVIIATATNQYGSVTAKINVTQKADNSHVTKGEEWSYTFTNTDFATANTTYYASYNELTLGFKSSIAKNSFDSQSNRGVQFGAAKGEFTITVSGYDNGVESVQLVVSSNAATNTISATVGGVAIGSQITIANANNQVIKFNSSTLLQGGDIVLSVNDKAKSVYFKSITINPDGGTTEDPVQLVMSNITCSNSGQNENSLAFSWTAVDNAEGYQVSEDGINFGSTQSACTYTLSNLQPGTTHTIWVKAIGNGTTTTDSDAKESESGTTKSNGGSGGNPTTSTLTFTAACGGSGTADDGVEWTVSSDGEESAFDATRGIHYGTGKKAVQFIKLSTSDITGTITKVVVNASTASGVSATVDVAIGGAAFGGAAQSLSTSAANYTFSGSASGEIVVTVTKPSSANGALYVKSVAVTYTD